MRTPGGNTKTPKFLRSSSPSSLGSYPSIMQDLPIAILVLDGDGRIFDMNDRFVALSGYAIDELKGENLDSLLPEGKAVSHRSHCEGFRSAPHTRAMGFGLDLRLRARSGRMIPISIGLSSVISGKDTFILASVSDLSELAEAQAARAEIEKNLKALNRDLESMVEERTKELTAAYASIMRQRQLQDDVETAGQIQASLLPHVFPMVEGLDFASKVIPSRFVSGDFYDYQLVDGKRLSIMVADIAGKGIPAALLASSARSLYLRALKDGSAGAAEDPKGPAAILKELNRELFPDLELAERFITMIAARFDPETGSLEVANAGGCAVIVFDCLDSSSRTLECGGLPIGIFSAWEAETSTVRLRPGMGALFYSDGITEASNGAGDLLGLPPLLETVAANAGKDADEIATAIFAEVERFRGDSPPSDDASLIVLKSLPKSLRRDFVAGPAAVDEAPRWVAEACFPYGETLARDMELAVSEAVANIWEHGYGAGEGPLSFDLRLGLDGVALTIRERGLAFDPGSVPLPALGEPGERGFGLFLIREVTDEFTYKPGGIDGNEWILTRSIGARDGES